MKKLSLMIMVSLFSFAGIAVAQDTGGIRESTDPAKAAAVEAHARELQAQQSGTSQQPSSSAYGSDKAKKARHHKGMSKSRAGKAPSSGGGGAANSATGEGMK